MHLHNEIDYVEFWVSDMAATKRFYTEAFGWQLTDYARTYVGIQGKEKEMGGFFETDEARRSENDHTLAVIYSNDLERTLGLVKAAGATIEKEIFSFPGGRRFEFLAPGGSRAAVWSDK